MDELTLNRMQKGMSYADCVLAISDNVIGLIVILPEISEKSGSILKNGASPYGVLSLFDAMRIYGDDLATLFSVICKKDEVKLLTVIWAYEIGSKMPEVPNFAKLEAIKKLIQDSKVGINSEGYPFEEARMFIEANSTVRIPVADFSFLEKNKGIIGIVKDAWAFVTNKEARVISKYNYPNGNHMSVRDAKRAGLM